LLRNLFILALLLLPSYHPPKDPEKTLERVQHGVLRVGVVQEPPWALINDGQVLGLEVEMVYQLAAVLQARIKWVAGGESKLMEALRRYELDLVVGGLTSDSPWRRRVALTHPYFCSRTMIGFPRKFRPRPIMDRQKIAVRTGSLAAHLVRRRGAVPVAADAPEELRLPVAAEEWQLQVWGMRRSAIVLEERAHVLAVPPGENGWLYFVDRFLSQYRSEFSHLFHQGWTENAAGQY